MTTYADHNGLSDTGLPPIAHGLRGEAHADEFKRSGALAESFSRRNTMTHAAPMASGVLQMTAIYLSAGQTISTITYSSGGTPLGTGSNQWAALYSSALAKLAVSADRTNTAWSANEEKAFTLATPYLVVTSGLYYCAVLIVASTIPTLVVQSGQGAVSGRAPILSGTSSTGLTDPASAPDPAGAITGQTNTPYVWVS